MEKECSLNELLSDDYKGIHLWSEKLGIVELVCVQYEKRLLIGKSYPWKVIIVKDLQHHMEREYTFDGRGMFLEDTLQPSETIDDWNRFDEILPVLIKERDERIAEKQRQKDEERRRIQAKKDAVCSEIISFVLDNHECVPHETLINGIEDLIEHKYKDIGSWNLW